MWEGGCVNEELESLSGFGFNRMGFISILLNYVAVLHKQEKHAYTAPIAEIYRF
ncbi:hypothetical protein A33Q_4504 [Indibacter alkaliphilus LW1]|uniref:Uncharacterized protein n=1 Tax=Indibacter alkaliphilus (strain CCUG 57479 / KCTC 22604 / LW1) TaxID=1189612 RepID=S2DK91_INDAL|nr:hypothetical protein A33Q_4504 [Indibacter alkaliphilus LW1]